MRTFKNFQVYSKDMALVILVGACHVVVVRGNFLWTSTDKSRGEEGGPNEKRSGSQKARSPKNVKKPPT